MLIQHIAELLYITYAITIIRGITMLSYLSWIALGAVVGSLWWVIFIVYILPYQLKKVEAHVIEQVEIGIPKYLGEIAEAVQTPGSEEFETLRGVGEAFTAIMWNSLTQDPHFKEAVQGYINGKLNTIWNTVEEHYHIRGEDIAKLQGWLAQLPPPGNYTQPANNPDYNSGGGGFDIQSLLRMFFPLIAGR